MYVQPTIYLTCLYMEAADKHNSSSTWGNEFDHHQLTFEFLATVIESLMPDQSQAYQKMQMIGNLYPFTLSSLCRYAHRDRHLESLYPQNCSDQLENNPIFSRPGFDAL